MVATSNQSVPEIAIEQTGISTMGYDGASGNKDKPLLTIY